MDLVKCVAQYRDIQKKMHDVLERQQKILEKTNKLGCHEEFVGFLIRVRQFEFDNYKKDLSSPVSQICINTLNYINRKSEMLDQLEAITHCSQIEQVCKRW